jgi:hypothetical protein
MMTMAPIAWMPFGRAVEWYSSGVSGAGEWHGDRLNGAVLADAQQPADARLLASLRRSVAPACVVIYLAVVLALLVVILHRDDHVFTYTLDDPYIHLALAESLAHGHYGINLGEASSPSSSILWPFLLAPMARTAWGEYVPLALNLLFCGMTAWLIGRIVDGWRSARKAVAGWFDWTMWLAVASSLMLAANLAGLTFVGMEHGLQVLLAVACAAGMVEAFAGRRIPAWCVGAALLGPMVRYENFALVAALAIVLVAQQRRGTAVRMVLASLVGPLLFSLFLLSRGLPMLPSSVLVKASAYSGGGQGVVSAIVLSLYHGQIAKLMQWPWDEQLALTAVLVWLALRERQPLRRWVLRGALTVAVLQLAVGRVGWFHRYEIYALAFTALVAATALMETTRIPRWTLLLVGLPYARAIQLTPAAASNVYQQQYQMHRFVADFYRKSVAVNDLGWVSYQRPPGVYVLDLWGLASPEASRQQHKNAAWLDGVTEEHGAGLAIIYPDWYEQGAPEDWDALARMCITSRDATAAGQCVTFYRTEVGDKAELERELAAFARSLPAGTTITLGPASADGKK